MTQTTSRPSPVPPPETASRVMDAVERARAASPGWRSTAPAGRAGHLREAAAAVRGAADELADLLCLTTGRLLGEARESARVAADLLDEAAVTGLVGGRALAGGPGAIDLVRHEPRGVVSVITPWNDPYPAAAGLMAAALVTGNTVVHKPSERSSAPGARLTELIAGHLPTGVLELVEGGAEAGAALADHRGIDLVAHIGSSAAGASVRVACAARGAACVTENGGKDALLVDAGVDPVWAAQQIAVGSFTNAGQLCTSVERIYLHHDVAKALLEELVRRAESLVFGDPRDPTTTMAALVDERALATVDHHVQEALGRGARLLTGGMRSAAGTTAYAPTVLDGCTDDMLVMAEETFGPVAAVAVVNSWDEALQRASSGRYGLAATVLTDDPRHALQAIDELDVGTVKVNAVFGGAPGGSADPRRDSGRGVGYGPGLLREMVVLKAVHWAPATRTSRG
ncbi:MAG TPA: aldehyde dehydrogenase family protein [Ornithinibacter sp.]|nr:aldehyde dehydrogenase family protein [Ornithinibacter sp.]